MRAVYATVEKVMRASDIKSSAYLQEEILEALASASDDVDKLVSQGDATRPAFAPWVGSITFDWPTSNNWDSYRFWLNQFRLHSLTAMESGGDDVLSVALPWPASGPPYSAIAIDTEGADSLDVGRGTGQRSLTITGTWGTLGEDRSRSAWTLGASVGSSEDALLINAPIGIGSIALIGSERVIVTARSWADSGQTASALASNVAGQSVLVADGSAFLAGEEILIDAERMLIRDVANNTLIVQRATSGTVLAAHTIGAPIYWARSCTVERGALGTTGAAHLSGDAISIYRAPALVEQLTIAYAIWRRGQESAGYMLTIGQGESERRVVVRGIADLEHQVISAYGRIRHRAI